MKIALPGTIILGGVISASLVVWLFAGAERLVTRPVENVPLYDPMSLSGQLGSSPKQVGKLLAGEEIQVLECVDRKTDINVHVRLNGEVVVVGEWEAKIQVLRVRVFPWEQGATRSCLGHFEGKSSYA